MPMGVMRNTFRFFAWIFRPFTNVLAIPLVPFLLNIVVKVYCRLPFGWDYFDGATFCLAIALYSLAVIRNIYRMNDDKPKDDLSKPYKVCLMFFLGIYILSLHASTVLLRDVFGYITNMKIISEFEWFDANKMSATLRVGNDEFLPPESGILVLNIITIVVGVAWLEWSEKNRKNYKIEGDLI